MIDLKPWRTSFDKIPKMARKLRIQTTIPPIGVCARGGRGHQTYMVVMTFKGRVPPTATHTHMVMGVVASRMLPYKGDGRSGRHGQDEEGGEAAKAG